MLSQGLQKGEQSSPRKMCIEVAVGEPAWVPPERPWEAAHWKKAQLETPLRLNSIRPAYATTNSHKASTTFISPSLPCSHTVRVRNLRASWEIGEGRASTEKCAKPHRPHPTTVPRLTVTQCSDLCSDSLMRQIFSQHTTFVLALPSFWIVLPLDYQILGTFHFL